jgi:hypothetical protein
MGEGDGRHEGRKWWKEGSGGRKEVREGSAGRQEERK